MATKKELFKGLKEFEDDGRMGKVDLTKKVIRKIKRIIKKKKINVFNTL